MSIRLFAAGAAIAALLFAPSAFAAVDIAGRMVNHPAADQWSVSGSNQHQMVKDDKVNGGSAFQITTEAAGASPWDVQAGVPTSKPVKKGDVVLLAFWARAVSPDSVQIPARIQQAAAPYTAVASENLTITGNWKLYYVSGTAAQDYEAGQAGVSLHLATGAQTVALGPVFLLDFGPGYNAKFLPRNIP